MVIPRARRLRVISNAPPRDTLRSFILGSASDRIPLIRGTCRASKRGHRRVPGPEKSSILLAGLAVNTAQYPMLPVHQRQASIRENLENPDDAQNWRSASPVSCVEQNRADALQLLYYIPKSPAVSVSNWGIVRAWHNIAFLFSRLLSPIPGFAPKCEIKDIGHPPKKYWNWKYWTPIFLRRFFSKESGCPHFLHIFPKYGSPYMIPFGAG